MHTSTGNGTTHPRPFSPRALLTAFDHNLRAVTVTRAASRARGLPPPPTRAMVKPLLSGTVTVTAKDANGNTATSYGGTVHVTSSDAAAILPANATLTNGVGSFSVTLKTPGLHTITATDTATSTITGAQTGITANGIAGGERDHHGTDGHGEWEQWHGERTDHPGGQQHHPRHSGRLQQWHHGGYERDHVQRL